MVDVRLLKHVQGARAAIGGAYKEGGELVTGEGREARAEAARGRPDANLEPYASDRGLEWLDHRSASGFGAVMPQFEELQHNVMRGELPGGERGIIFHEVVIVGRDQGRGDSVNDHLGWKSFRLGDDTPNPWKTLGFYQLGVKAPFTVAAAQVPQATGALAAFRVDRRELFAPYNFPEAGKLDDRGLEGWRLRAVKEADRGALDRLLSGPVRELLATDPFGGQLQLVFWHGTLIVRCSGFLSESRQLDQLAHALSLTARELRAVGRAAAKPRPLSDHLPPATWSTVPEPQERGIRILGATVRRGGTIDPFKGHPFEPPPGSWWCEQLRAAAHRYRMELEDPLAYHLAFPEIAVPGHAFAVLRGTIPGTDRDGRIALHTEKDLDGFNDGRNAVLFPVHADLPETVPGGEPVPETDLRLSVRGGILAIWNRRSIPAQELGNLDALVADATRLATARGY